MVRPPKATDADSLLIQRPSGRRWLWESNEATVTICKFLIIVVFVLLGLLGFSTVTIFRIYNQPMPVLSDELGYVRYHTTDAYRLTGARIRAFLESTLVRMLSVSPGFYDISDLDVMVHSSIVEGFSGLNSERSDLRIKDDIRQLFTIYEIKRYYNPSYPKLLNYVVRGERTVYQRQRNSNNDVAVVPNSEIVYWAVYLDKVRPSPDNPYGLMMVGASLFNRETADAIWPQAVALEDSLKSESEEK